MQAVKISCPHCSRSITIDASKLPKQKASFGCPGCKGKVVVDPDEIQSAVSPPEPEVTAPASALENGNGDVAPVDLELPPGATFPPGIIVGGDAETIAAIRRIVEPFECELETLPDAATVRARAHEDLPALIFFVAGKVDKPPLEVLAPITSMASSERRRTFVVLVANNLGTLDAKAAFLYLVNLTVATKDVESLPTVVYSGLDYHNRLYRPLFSAIEATQEILD